MSPGDRLARLSRSPASRMKSGSPAFLTRSSIVLYFFASRSSQSRPPPPLQLQPIPRCKKRVKPGRGGRVGALAHKGLRPRGPRGRIFGDVCRARCWAEAGPSRSPEPVSSISSCPVDGRCDFERDPLGALPRRSRPPTDLTSSLDRNACLRSRYVTTTSRSDMDMLRWAGHLQSVAPLRSSNTAPGPRKEGPRQRWCWPPCCGWVAPANTAPASRTKPIDFIAI